MERFPRIHVAKGHPIWAMVLCSTLVLEVEAVAQKPGDQYGRKPSFRAEVQASVDQMDAARGEEEKVRRRSNQEIDETARRLTRLISAENWQEALLAGEKLLALQKRALGEQHLEVGITLCRLAMIDERLEKLDVALSLFESALAVRENALDSHHLLIAETLRDLGRLSRRLGLWSRAEAFHRRSLGMYRDALGPRHFEVARDLRALAQIYESMGDGFRAAASKKDAVDIEAAADPAEHTIEGTIRRLRDEVIDRLHSADYAAGLPASKRLLAMSQQAFAPGDRNIATALLLAGAMHYKAKDPTHAESYLDQALPITEHLSAEDRGYFEMALRGLMAIAREKGDEFRVLGLQERLLALQEQESGADSDEVLSTAHALARAHTRRMEYGAARTYYDRIRGTLEKRWGSDDPRLMEPLMNAAEAEELVRNDAGARMLYKRALALSTTHAGAKAQVTAVPLFRLGRVFRREGDLSKARDAFERAYSILEQARNDGPAAWVAVELALVHVEQGEIDAARRIYSRALPFWLAADDSKISGAAMMLDRVAELALAMNDVPRAVALQTRAAEARERELSSELKSAPEHRRWQLLLDLAGETSAIVSLHAVSAPDNRDALRLALVTVLRRKARVLEAMAQSAAAYRGPAGTWLNFARELRAGAAFSHVSDAEERNIERVFSEMIASDPSYATSSAPVSLDAVQAAIPSGTSLIEFVLYSPFNAGVRGGDGRYGPLRYAAYVLSHGADPTWADLGPAAIINAEVGKLRAVLGRPSCQTASCDDLRSTARAVDRRLVQPLRPLLGSARRVLISPDGLLHLVPFAALIDEDDRYLIERYTFTYLGSGRELVRQQKTVASREQPLIVADPDFNEMKGVARNEELFRRLELPAPPYQFERQNGMHDEAEALRALFPRARVLTGPTATKTALRDAHGPRILHIATHGFFMDDATPPQRLERGLMFHRALDPHFRPQDPMVLSGLAMAGANRRISVDDNGILTALEASGLDLEGTRLVVLSACDTGMGEVITGEGVLGLRRAFAAAGAETIIMTLWRVNDAATPLLMERYYRKLLKGGQRGESLREAQLSLLAQPMTAHPYYWAPYVLAGKSGPLDE